MTKTTNGKFRVDLCKEQLIFSSAHFITFNGDICESLHGHNYGLKCEVMGTLDENGYVVDFIALRDALAELSKRLDHRMLLPMRHEKISVLEQGDEIEVRFEKKRWIFPKEDCVLLPISNTTAELLAWWIGVELTARLKEKLGQGIERIIVSVDENNGQWGVCELDWN